MGYMIAAYRSRSVSMKIYYRLQEKGFTCSLVSTPHAANVGCGLSVRFDRRDVEKLREPLSSAPTFAGIFLVQNFNGKTVVVRA